MSDEKPDCCECKIERFEFFLNISPVGGDTQEIRGSPLGFFGAARPAQAVIHSDWCKHRPTKAMVGVSHDTAAPNGTIRVFVEGARDFSKYVWAELEYEAAVAFPDLDTRNHTSDGVAITGGAYKAHAGLFSGPVFGIANGSHEPTFQDAEDPDGYIKSPWPLWVPNHVAPGFVLQYNNGTLVLDWHGTRCRLRWGTRQEDTDSILGSVAFPESFASTFGLFGEVTPKGEVGAFGIGCHWTDIVVPNDDQNVRCGVEFRAFSLQFGFGFLSDIFLNEAFNIPFELPRDFFTDSASPLPIKPPLPYRMVGIEATAPTETVALSYQPPVGEESGAFVFGPSTNLDAFSVQTFVTCGARRAAVFIPPSLQSESGILPIAAVGPSERPEDGIIRNDAPVFVRRPDLIERSQNHVANADSWHSTHLVRLGSDLAQRGALHELHLEIEPCTFPGGNQRIVPDYVSSGPMRAGLLAVGGSDFAQRVAFFGGITFNNPTPGTQFAIAFPDDVTQFPDDMPLTPAWIWDALSGSHTLEPFGPNGEQLVPNAYHVFYDEPTVTVTNNIVAPEGYEGEGQAFQLDPVQDIFFPFLQNQDEKFEEYEDVPVPARLRDYRGEWQIEAFPQLWATTQNTNAFERVGPRDISLEDSDMTTEAYDRYSSPSHRVDYLPESTGVTVRVFGRVGVKISLSRVQGFRRTRVRQEEPGQGIFFRATGGVGVYGDYSMSDVACHDAVFDFDIPLTGSDVAALSDGEEITKQLLAGSYFVPNEEDPENDDEVSVFRTVRLRVSKVEGE